jgi:putative ABC transport system permease protein
MFNSYLKTILRNIKRYKAYNFINVFGLSIGLASAIFIFLWVVDEISFDKFHTDSDGIYKVLINQSYPDGRIETYGATPALLKESLHSEIPEVKEIAQLSMDTKALFELEENSFYANGVFADPSLFSIFSFPLLKGNEKDPIPGISSVAISEKLASKLFGTEEALGKSIQVNQTHQLKVTSVFADVPNNSSLQFDFVIPFELFVKENPWTQHWKSGGSRTFLSLTSEASLEQLNSKIEGLIKKNCSDCSTTPFLFPFHKSRLYGSFENGKSVGGRIEQVVLFSFIAVIILMMACINFMNLATAQSAIRSKEVGVRKLVGAGRPALIQQFMAEAIILSFIALLLALIMVWQLLPFFNQITNKSLIIDFSEPVFIIGILLITIICGLCAGSYPSFFLSSFKPLLALKGNIQTSLSGVGLRKTLVIIQFVVSIVLITGSIIIYEQIAFISNKNLGFDKDNIVLIDSNEELIKNNTSFKNELLKSSSVKDVAFAGSNIFTVPITTTDVVWPGMPENSSLKFKLFRCDDGFIPTLNIDLLEGRNFLDANQDGSNYIINKKAMEVMGLKPENVIGTEIEVWNGPGRIIGLTDDFHNDHLSAGIEPLVFLYTEQIGQYFLVKVDHNKPMKETLSEIEKVFKKASPQHPFEYSFLDEAFNREYQSEVVIGKLSMSFTIVAVLISCLGLFGLASFNAERRIKELGIRKVLGASISELVLMLCSDFIKLVAIGLLIGIPLAWYLGSSYLSGYAFHTSISVWTFVSTTTAILFIALLSVAFQAIKASMANPVNSLKSE